MTTHFSEPLHVPSATGREAFVELDRVKWDDLEHAYHQKGTPKHPAAFTHDVAASIRRLGDERASAMDEPIEALFASICHQGGTIYEATAYAVPFIAAFAAGTALSDEQAQRFVQLLGSIGVAASFEARSGSHAGSFGPNVAPVTRQAIRTSMAHLHAMALRTPALEEVAEALAALVRPDSPDAAAVARLRALTGDDHEDEDEDN
jgi:UDP-N-acetylglucosamine:LPS N-acetylglucosamine transferase